MQVACVERDKIARLEAFLFGMPQADVITDHTFPEGKYERKITVPPWTVLTGAAHKTPYRVRLEQGTIAVTTDDGVKILTAPIEFDAPAGTQRVGRVFEQEVTWVDVYDNPDNCRDITALEDRLYVVPDIGMADNRTAAQKARIDYNVFLHQIGVSRDEVYRIASIESDLIDMPPEYEIELKDSPIHGKGCFAVRDYDVGGVICPGRLNSNRTPAGRYINHSGRPNVMPVLEGDDIWVIALKSIRNGDELTVDYRVSMYVNFGTMLQGETA